MGRPDAGAPGLGFTYYFKDIKWTETTWPTFFGADVIDSLESE
jgi:hypothetical protein